MLVGKCCVLYMKQYKNRFKKEENIVKSLFSMVLRLKNNKKQEFAMQLCTFIYLNFLIKNCKFAIFDTKSLPMDLITFLTSDFSLFIFNIHVKTHPLPLRRGTKTIDKKQTCCSHRFMHVRNCCLSSLIEIHGNSHKCLEILTQT